MNTLRLAVVPTPPGLDGFQVQVWVDGVELTAEGAGLGMDPYDVLVPTNRFVATTTPTTIPVGRCDCGVYGCAATDVTITRMGDVVRWDWLVEKPIDGPSLFAAAGYDAEVARVAADTTWETPLRTAGRLVLSTIGTEDLPEGVSLSWVSEGSESDEVLVCLVERQRYQIFVAFPWEGRTPEALAAEVRRILVEAPPASWPASWSDMTARSGPPPSVAGDGWTRRQY